MVRWGAHLLGHETSGGDLLNVLGVLSIPVESSEKRSMRSRLKRQYAAAKVLAERYRDSQPTSREGSGLDREAWEAGIRMLEASGCLRREQRRYVFLMSPEECLRRLDGSMAVAKVRVDLGIAPTFL